MLVLYPRGLFGTAGGGGASSSRGRLRLMLSEDGSALLGSKAAQTVSEDCRSIGLLEQAGSSCTHMLGRLSSSPINLQKGSLVKIRLHQRHLLPGHCNDKIRYIEDIEDNARVVGGSNAARNAWPWQVSLQYRSGTNWYHTCGGSLIRINRVMTAAHCVDRTNTYRVVLGEHNLSQNDGTEQVISVSGIRIHSGWNSNNVAAGYDIAILHLASSATINSYVKLATLPANGAVLANNYNCIISGWGRTSTGGSLPSILQQAPLPVVAHSTCSTSSYWGSTVKTTMVCAGGNGVQAGCNGDSGGPLNCAVNGVYQVHGVTSFVSSLGCNAYLKPTVFTRVSAYISWINSNL